MAIVIPVYNEAENLPALLSDWQPVFQSTGASYRVILIDDGSADGSLALLQQLQSENPTLSVHTQPNAGHGPAILKGYRLAKDAEWVFQIDSDHQLDTARLRPAWANRERYDLLIAERRENNASLARRCVSRVTAKLVHLLYNAGIRDVNCPYRLMRCSFLQKAIDRIPARAFAPNVLLTGWFLAKKVRIFTTVTGRRKEGVQRQSRMNPYFLKGVWQSTIQMIQFRRKL